MIDESFSPWHREWYGIISSPNMCSTSH
jgi:hypothetical protein